MSGWVSNNIDALLCYPCFKLLYSRVSGRYYVNRGINQVVSNPFTLQVLFAKVHWLGCALVAPTDHRSLKHSRATGRLLLVLSVNCVQLEMCWLRRL